MLSVLNWDEIGFDLQQDIPFRSQYKHCDGKKNCLFSLDELKGFYFISLSPQEGHEGPGSFHSALTETSH